MFRRRRTLLLPIAQRPHVACREHCIKYPITNVEEIIAMYNTTTCISADAVAMVPLRAGDHIRHGLERRRRMEV